MIKETHFRPEEIEYSQGFKYDTTGACTIAHLWADAEGGLWVESNDGQRVVIPAEVRKLVAKRVRDTLFR